MAVFVVAGCSNSGSTATQAGGDAPRGSVIECAERAFSDEVSEFVGAPLGEPLWTMASDEATFSSPRTADLNGDGVLDVVQGMGQDTLGARESSVVAVDGSTGQELWRSSGHDDLIGSAVFASLGGDNTVDVVIGGRRGALLAIDGATGRLLWTFDDQAGRWFNFYSSQIVTDHDGDGVVDVVAANGGLVIEEPEEGGGMFDANDRHLGTMFLISGANGSVISSVRIADQRESYMSPVVLPAYASGETSVLVGTGGETLPGSLWRLPLASLAADHFDDAQVLVSGGDKGVIASPSVADLTADCVADVVVQAFDGTVTAIDRATNDTLWTVTNPGFETYSTPTLAYLVGDDQVPDVFTAVARGVWPQYESSDYMVIDGATGKVVWRDTLGTFAPSGFVAADLNGDGRDEVIFGVNDVGANTHQMFVLESHRGQLHELGEPLSQTTFSSPWLGDLDNDGSLDLLLTESAYQSNGAARLHRYQLNWTAPEHVSWGGYLGSYNTGALHDDLRAVPR